ncbi:hypothetical protein V2E39_00570 [Chryseobacterium arthrosphaerae]|uniref:Uncharacterized protein n=1 Tax=Chryseobacterium arthrosphaerae TaxID=651561 RepID=A0ABU7QTK8_9FLAO|nr:hypothetical protein [Chryseobacterium arthrosphaerae]
MMKEIISTLLLATGMLLSAQVGINTNSPKSTLDVNGDVNFRNKIAVFDANNNVSQGNNDQLLVSQGPGYPPVWKSLRIPEYEANKFYLIYNNSFSDNEGLIFTTADESTVGQTSRGTTFTKGKSFSSLPNFKKITNLTQEIEVFSTQSKAYFQFETVVHTDFSKNGSPDTSIDYACGIFVDDKLINLRQRNIKASSAAYTFFTHTQIGIVENLSKGKHTVSVACTRLASYGELNRKLTIGTYAFSNLNDFITQSSLKVDVFEVPEVFKPIIN